MTADNYESRLTAFDLRERTETLVALKDSEAVKRDVSKNVNMHFHSFYSYNS